MKNPENFDKRFLSVVFALMLVLTIIAAFMFGERTLPKAISATIEAVRGTLASLPDL